jgi:hypothetical protein
MNYRISKTWGVLANVVWQDRVLCNDYRIRVDWITATDDAYEQNVAYDRIKYWLFDVMEHSVMIPQDHALISAFRATGQRVITLPGDPIDAVIAMMLITKLSAITEQRMELTEIAVSSEQGGHVQHLHSTDEDPMMFAEPGWWQDPGPVWNTIKPRRGNKIVNLDRMPEWSELDLAWETTADIKKDGSVVFAEFKKNAD